MTVRGTRPAISRLGRAFEQALCQSRDPVILGAVATMLMLVTLVPARRAARIAPQAVLRAD